MATIFSKIIAGEIPCHRVAEDENFIAFLDIRPRTAGHTLVVPKKEVDYIFDHDQDTYLALWSFARRVAKAVESVVPCQRIGLSVIGLEVPHTHVHVIPINQMGDVNFQAPAYEMSQEAMGELASKIAAAFR